MGLFSKKIDFDLVDIHNHILPGIDDGSKDISTTTKMLEIAYDEGIRTIVVTPHFHPTKCRLGQEGVVRAADALQDMASQLYSDMKIYSGREIFYTSGVEDEIEKLNMEINSSRYLLVEFDYMSRKQDIRNGVINVLNSGKTPIVAHVERYINTIDDEDFIYDLKDLGALIQVNASSVDGDMGTAARNYTRKLLKDKLVDLVASDAHSAGHRAPRMKNCVKWIISKCGEEYAKEVAFSNAMKIINNEII